MRSWLAQAGALALLAILIAPSVLTPSSAQGVGLPANVVDYTNALVKEETFPTTDGAGHPAGNARWRIVTNTGNCCENYVTANPRGRLFDLGGTYIRYSDNYGETWKEVRSISRLVNGEGAISVAPGGDIVASTWDPYSGDHLLAFKYDAASETWLHQETLLHTPFFDRPWFTVVPGPFTFGTINTPYITILKGGWPSKDLMYISYDGLNYFTPSATDSSDIETLTKSWLKVPPQDHLDWIQPNTSTGIAPIGKLGALAYVDDQFDVGIVDPDHAALMQSPDADWDAFAFPKGPVPPGRFQVDSRGWLHRITENENDNNVAKSFTWHVSSNGGRDWTSTRMELPAKHRIEDWDFKVNAKLGLGALAVHAHRNAKEESDEVDQDLVYEVDIHDEKPRLERIYYVGAGDINVGAGLGASLRFDFATVTIMPDRTIVTSFVDSLHTSPALAILRSR